MQVLIADDSPVSRRLLNVKVAQWGYEPVVVEDGRQAWETLTRIAAPRIAILDWRMPGMDGTEICEKLRSRIDGPYTYVILMTSCNLASSAVDGLRAGADDFVRKPFDPDELEQRLRTGRRITELQDRLLAAQAELRIQATHDSLTGMWNRGAILQMLEREWDRMQRQNAPMGVLMIDLDNFKRINDEHGHQAGDDALRTVSRLMTQAVRSYDQVGRYGGEEFLVVAPNATLKNAVAIAERIRFRVDCHPVSIGDLALPLTVSIGVASSAEFVDGGKDLAHRADQALYAAKRSGRNRVCTFQQAMQLQRSAPSLAESQRQN
ncbi:MAG: diguanylate cyclase [Planctomyces sp.]|nr:diguanylate cyclase [Planctomyces sp.]